MRGPGSVGHGWHTLGREQCLRGRGEGAAESRPTLQGFRRTQLQRVGVRGGGSRVGGRMLAGLWWWASGCVLLLRGRNATCGRRGRGRQEATLTRRGEKTSRVVVTCQRLMFQASAVGPLGHSSFDLATCRSNCMLRCATSRHAMPCAPCASMQCHARPARPRDMQCHAHPMPCTSFF